MLSPVTKIKRLFFFFFRRNLGENYVRAIKINTARRVLAFLSHDSCISPRALLFFVEIRLISVYLSDTHYGGSMSKIYGIRYPCHKSISPISTPLVLRNKGHILRKLNKVARSLIQNHMSLRSCGIFDSPMNILTIIRRH